MPRYVSVMLPGETVADEIDGLEAKEVCSVEGESIVLDETVSTRCSNVIQ